jgi:hypothetical protein
MYSVPNGSDDYAVGYRDIPGFGTICLINIRGTNSGSYDISWINTPADWGSNLYANRVGWYLDWENGSNKELNPGKNVIHIGFRDSMRRIRKDIDDNNLLLDHNSNSTINGSKNVVNKLLENYPGVEIPTEDNKDLFYFIIGHSRGGALAELLALKLSEEGVDNENIIVYSHASAPYGSKALKNYAQELGISKRIYKTIGIEDPINKTVVAYGWSSGGADNTTISDHIEVIPKGEIGKYNYEFNYFYNSTSEFVKEVFNAASEFLKEQIYYHMPDTGYIPWLYNQAYYNRSNNYYKP